MTDWKRYYTRWLAKAFNTPWMISGIVGAILSYVFGYLQVRYPQWAPTMNHLIWQIPLAAFFILAFIVIIVAPCRLYREDIKSARKEKDKSELDAKARESLLEQQINTLQDRLSEQDASGPNIFIDYPEKVEGYQVGIPLVLTNTSDEPACDVRIEPILNCGCMATFDGVPKVLKGSPVKCVATVTDEGGASFGSPVLCHDLRRLLAAGPAPQNLAVC
jgi:hypothetical protein